MTSRPLDVWPGNPRYLRFRGEPTCLITSAEHYGAVFNLDFDYHAYLAELTRCRFNFTRTASGTFIEDPDTIEGSRWENTQAPRPGRFLAPWERSERPRDPAGGFRFDLEQISGAYLDRLIDFVGQAALRGVVVEFTLFTAQYSPGHWILSPMHPENNINSIGAVNHDEVYHVDNGGLLPHQLAFCRHVVDALIGYDNVIIELINEPYFSGVEPAWIDTVIATLEERFAHHGRRHPIAWNYANISGQVEGMNPGIDIFNFHYANPPTVIEENQQTFPIVYDETGFLGVDDTLYRVHAWEFLLAGGAGFNHLDYSYAPSGDDRGTRVLPGNASGGGSPRLRDQLTVLRDFMAALPIELTEPVTMTVHERDAGSHDIRGLAAPGQCYAFYLHGAVAEAVTFDAEPGDYVLRWIDPLTGFAAERPMVIDRSGPSRINTPAQRPEVAGMLVRQTPRRERVVGDFDFVEAVERGAGHSDR